MFKIQMRHKHLNVYFASFLGPNEEVPRRKYSTESQNVLLQEKCVTYLCSVPGLKPFSS